MGFCVANIIIGADNLELGWKISHRAQVIVHIPVLTRAKGDLRRTELALEEVVPNELRKICLESNPRSLIFEIRDKCILRFVAMKRKEW